LRVYSRYIFKKTFTTFVGFITIFISLIWFSRAISFVKYVTENGVKLSQFFSLFLLILPWLLLLIIPIALFCGILLVYNRMIGSNEITILKNSGLTHFSICKPIWPIAIICTLFCYLISFYLMPFANKELRLSRINFKNNYASLAFAPQTFETLNQLTIYARNRDEENRLAGIILHDERAAEYSITITAKNGNIVSENNSALLYMSEGTVQKFNYKTLKTEILNFDNYVFNLTETQKSDDKMRWKPKERYLKELLEPNDDSTAEDLEKYRAEIHQRIIYPLLPIIFSAIALAFILRGKFNRRGNFVNIIAATAVATTFLVLTLTLFDAIESSATATPLLYLNLVLFLGICYVTLNENSRKKYVK
jgi:lipopolysaccharide export system permease protein